MGREGISNFMYTKDLYTSALGQMESILKKILSDPKSGYQIRILSNFSFFSIFPKVINHTLLLTIY